MGGQTAAPWSLPYPTGTDRVADGDNAIQALAERQTVVDGLLPRGLISRAAGGSAVISDVVGIALPAFTTTESRDFAAAVTVQGKSVSAGTGATFTVQDNGATVGSPFTVIWAPSSFDATAAAVLTFTLPAGAHLLTLRFAGYGALNNTTSSSALALIDLGSSGAVLTD